MTITSARNDSPLVDFVAGYYIH